MPSPFRGRGTKLFLWLQTLVLVVSSIPFLFLLWKDKQSTSARLWAVILVAFLTEWSIYYSVIIMRPATRTVGMRFLDRRCHT
ncbi:hypothetical protein V8F06_014879 [Rhypophila decipiens]